MHQPRRRFPKRLLIIGGILAAVLVVAAVALPYLIDVNQYRGLIQSKAEEAIGRKVTLGVMSLSILPSIGIRVESPEVEGLLKADSLVVGVRLLPLLLSDTIDVRKVVLDRPSITVTRDAAGRWNFQDLAGGAGGAEQAGAEPASAGRSFRLSSLAMKDASIRLLDERSGSSLEIGLTANGSMEMSAAGDLEAAFDADLESQGISLVARGSLARSSSGKTEFDILVDRSDIQLATLRDLARSWDLPWPVPEGLIRSESLTLGGRAAGTLEGEALARLSLTDVVLTNADVRLERDRSGRWNFQTAGAGGASNAGGTSPAAGGPSIEARNVRIAGARVALHDEATGAGTADLVLEDLDVLVEELALDRPVRLEVQSRITPGDGTLKLSGLLPSALPAAGSQAAIDVRIELAGVQVETMSSYLEALLGSVVTSGTVSMTAAVNGEYPRRLETRATIDLDGITVPAAPRPVTARGELEGTLLDAAERMQIARFVADVSSSHVELRGSVDNSGAGTIVDIEVLPTSVDSDDLHDLLAISGTDLPFEFSAEKPIRLEAHVKGDIRSETAPELTGSVEVEQATFHHPSMKKPMERLAGKVTLEKDGFELTGFSAIIGSSDMAGSLSVRGLDAPRVSFEIESRRADFWELMSFVEGDGAGGGKPQAGSADAGADGVDTLDKVQARGTLKIGEGTFGTLAFSDLESTLAMEKKIITLDPVSMNLYTGSMSGSASMDMASDPPVVSVTARAARIDTDALLASNLEMKDTLAGALSGELTVTASGSDERTIIKSARGTGEIRLEDGKVGAVNVLGVLSKASNLMGERSLHEVSGRLAEEGTEFSSMVASMKLGGGEVKARKLSLVSPDLELAGEGSLDLIDGTIDVKGQIIFSEKLSQAMVDEGSRAVDVFWDSEAGRVNLPLTLAGPVDAPLPNIDWGEAGNKLVKRKVQESVQKKLAEAGLSQILGDQKSALPVKTQPAEKTRSERVASPPPSKGELAVKVEEARLTGNLLLPDLEVKGFLRGTAITSASLTVTDEDGNVLHESSLMRRVKTFYAENDRGVPQSIAFRYKVDGKDLVIRKGDISLAISVGNEGGETSTETVTIER